MLDTIDIRNILYKHCRGTDEKRLPFVSETDFTELAEELKIVFDEEIEKYEYGLNKKGGGLTF